MTHVMSRHRRLAAVAASAVATALVATGAALSSAGPATAAGAAAEQEPTSEAVTRTAQYLNRQVADDDLVHGEYQDAQGAWQDYQDYGLSADHTYAFRRLDAYPATRSSILDALEANAGSWTGTAWGDAYAGSIAKLLHVAAAGGRDLDTFAGGDLPEQLEARIVTTGPEQGRAKDSGTDYSNAIGQSFTVRSLALLDSALLDDATAFLLKQQCASGGFRLLMDANDFTCAGATGSDAKASVDATAHAVRALLAARAGGVTGLDDDLRDAVRWLARVQLFNGAFASDGVQNANSTGLAAHALQLTGHRGRAATAAAWIRRHQVDPATMSRFPKLRGENGAIAYSAADLAAAKRSGISRGARPTWRRAAAEGSLALPSLLPAERLTVSAPATARRATRVTVTVAGLERGERFFLRRGETIVARGWVPAGGVATRTVYLPNVVKKVTIRAFGSRNGRTGAAVVQTR